MTAKYLNKAIEITILHPISNFYFFNTPVYADDYDMAEIS